jgi:hypothetical protein
MYHYSNTEVSRTLKRLSILKNNSESTTASRIKSAYSNLKYKVLIQTKL